MTQLSTNTVVYDQIISKVSKFIIDYRENKFPTNKKLLEEYQNLISFLNQRVSRTNDRVCSLYKRGTTYFRKV